MPSPTNSNPRPSLSVWDTASLVIGIVVGTAIFKSPTLVFVNCTSVATALGLWVVGGVVSLLGALCYAELATCYPRSGGDYEYLTRAFGRWVGFQFAWAQLLIVITGSIGVMAYAFADYAVEFFDQSASIGVWWAITAVVGLSLVNLRGLGTGKRTQNILTMAKVIGFVAMFACGIALGDPQVLGKSAPESAPNLGLALVMVLYAYGGWNHAAFVTAEVSDHRRDIPRALILGIAAITVIYLAVVSAYVAVLGFDAARATQTPASDLLDRAVGRWGGKLASGLVMLSALGAINGMILTGARVYAVVGEDYRGLSWLGRWRPDAGAPITALVSQGGIVLAMIFGVGTERGRSLIDQVLVACGAGGAPWEKYHGGFDTLVAASAPFFWLFFLLTGLSLFRLRAIDADRERPFTVPLYPLTPILFCLSSAFMLLASLNYAGSLALVSLVPLVTGTLLFLAGPHLSDQNQ